MTKFRQTATSKKFWTDFFNRSPMIPLRDLTLAEKLEIDHRWDRVPWTFTNDNPWGIYNPHPAGKPKPPPKRHINLRHR